MDMLIVERVESKFLNFKFFWKDIKNDANASKMFLSFLLFLSMDFFGKKLKKKVKIGLWQLLYIYIYNTLKYNIIRKQ